MESNVFCTECGKQLNHNAKFCDACGTPTTKAVLANQLDFDGDVVVKDDDSAKRYPSTEPKKKRTVKTIVISVASTLVLVFIAIMVLGNCLGGEKSSSGGKSENGTEGNSWGIYVTGNTDLARLAGNTLIDKADFMGYYSKTCGDVFVNGHVHVSNNDFEPDHYRTFTDVSISVNESSTKPESGTIIIECKEYFDGEIMHNGYKIKWSAKDYGDHTTFTWGTWDYL